MTERSGELVPGSLSHNNDYWKLLEHSVSMCE